MDSLINYDKENIHENNLKAVQPYLDDPEFEPDFIRSKSIAAAGICAWALNIIKFYHVFCDVEPKRQALAAANAELAAAEEKLAKIKAKIHELDENLAELTASFERVSAHQCSDCMPKVPRGISYSLQKYRRGSSLVFFSYRLTLQKIPSCARY